MVVIEAVSVVSLGCPKNTVDSEVMLHELSKEYEIINDPAKADILVVNTCAFIKDAKEESINMIFELAKHKKNKASMLIVTGCLSQRYSEELLREIPEIDFCLGVEQYLNILFAIKRAKKGERFAMCDRIKVAISSKRKLITPKYTAYVKISEGCNNKCSFCAIPLIRGRYRSLPMEDIINEVKSLVDNGTKEIIFVAEDTTRYGVDIYKKPCLPELLEKVATIEGLKWLRVLYCYPDTLTKELIDTMYKHDNICKYLDIPLQHADRNLLESMNRRGTPDEFTDTIKYAREKGFYIRTTFIVGFPGETDEHFNNLVNYVNDMKFDRLGVFTYSPEEGTVGATMKNQVPEDVKNKRKDIIMTMQADISFENNQKRVGTVCEVIVESINEENIVCRSFAEAPDIDGLIIMPYDDGKLVGEMYNVKITSADTYDVYGEWL